MRTASESRLASSRVNDGRLSGSQPRKPLGPTGGSSGASVMGGVTPLEDDRSTTRPSRRVRIAKSTRVRFLIPM